MNKVLVAYFSASGVTARLAKKIAEVTNGDLYEIKPKVPYTSADLDWMDKNSRSSIEMNDKSSRPEIIDDLENVSNYDTVFIGFPIWWYIAPTIVNTFLEKYDFSGKKIITFATSGGSDMGKSLDNLKSSCPNAIFVNGRVFRANINKDELAKWIAGLNL